VRVCAKTERTKKNVVRENYKIKESEAGLLHRYPVHQIGIRNLKNATKQNQFNYINMKSILDKINKADEIQINKLELNKYEIKLGVAEDLLKAKAQMDAINKSLNDELIKLKNSDSAILKAKTDAQKIISDAQKNANKVYSDSKKTTANADKTLSQVANLLDKIDKQAKDLGLNPSTIPNYTSIDNLYNTISQEIKNVNGFTYQND